MTPEELREKARAEEFYEHLVIQYDMLLTTIIKTSLYSINHPGLIEAMRLRMIERSTFPREFPKDERLVEEINKFFVAFKSLSELL